MTLKFSKIVDLMNRYLAAKEHFLVPIIFLLSCFNLLSAQNAALFDNNPPMVPFESVVINQLNSAPISDYTIEAWFRYDGSYVGSGFQRLLYLAQPSRVEVGALLNGNLAYFISPLPGATSVVDLGVAINDNSCHHIALVKSGSSINIYLDGSMLTSVALGNSFANGTRLYMGIFPGSSASTSNWQGLIDDVRIWDTARTPQQIIEGMNAVSPSSAGLIAYLPMEANVNNQFVDITGNGNDAAINGSITLAQSCATTSTIEILNYWDGSIPLSEHCNDDPARFVLTPSSPPSGLVQSTAWESSDDGGASWITLPSPFNESNFPTAQGDIHFDCQSSPTGNVDRDYRALITYSDPQTNHTWQQYTTERGLKICCPIQPATIQIVPSGTYCEGDQIGFDVELISSDGFLASAPNNPDLNIEWSLQDGVTFIPLDNFQNQLAYNYTHDFAAVQTKTSLCFNATVTNCASKEVVFTSCVNYDPMPRCGLVEGKPNPPNLTEVVFAAEYDICRGDDASLGMIDPTLFQNCIPVWEYSYNGTNFLPENNISNPLHNTNVLPWNNGTWNGADEIFYRIKCGPLSTPSGCEPCFSNVVKINIVDIPAEPQITGEDMLCSDDFPVTLSVSNNPGAVVFDWFKDGEHIGQGDAIQALSEGCYWVEASNNCGVSRSEFHCIEACRVVPLISCPIVPNECACLGEPITLDASMSLYTCDPNETLTYNWTWDSNFQSSMTLTDIPASGGTTYTLEVVNPSTGCSSTTSLTVVPCDKN